MRRVTDAAVALAALLFCGFLGYLAMPWARSLEWGVTVGMLVVTVATVWVRHADATRARIAIATLVLASGLAPAASRVADYPLFPSELWSDKRFPALLCFILVLTCVGLLRRATWARWLGLALAAGGALGGGLNLVQMLRAGLAEYAPFAWTHGVFVMGTTLVLLTLGGRTMRDAYVRPGSVWSVQNRVSSAVHLSLLGGLVGLAMLLVYAWCQPVVASTKTSAFVLAGILLAGGLLTVAKKTVGVVLLVLGGMGLLAQSGCTLAGTWNDPDALHIAVYYSFFWVPAGLTALGCGVVLVGPLARISARSARDS